MAIMQVHVLLLVVPGAIVKLLFRILLLLTTVPTQDAKTTIPTYHPDSQ